MPNTSPHVGVETVSFSTANCELASVASLPHSRAGGGAAAHTVHRDSLPALTGLRFLAASYVIVFHTDIKDALAARGHVHAKIFVLNGYLAVPLFFLLSGFVLSYNYRKLLRSMRDAGRFWHARFARIWPVYVFSLIGCSVVVSHIPAFPLAVATLAMVQAWNPFHPEYADAWNGVCWSLSAEAFFYVLFPYLQRRMERLSLLGLRMLALVLLVGCVLLNSAYHTADRRYPGIFFYIIIPIALLPVFLTGMVFGNIFVTTPRTPRTWLGLFGISVNSRISTMHHRLMRFPLLTVIGSVSSIVVLATVERRWTGLVVPCFALVLYGLAAERSLLERILSTRILILGGEISYAMYLLRTPLHTWINLVPAFGQNPIVKLLYIPLGLIPISIFSYYVIEKPSRRYLRRLFGKVLDGTRPLKEVDERAV